MTQENVQARVWDSVNRVLDPCSQARGVPAGLVDMGLVVAVDLHHTGDGIRAEVTLRVTAPGCGYAPYFARRVDDQVHADVPEISSVELRWHDELDWSPSMMSAELRRRLAARSHSLPVLTNGRSARRMARSGDSHQVRA